MGTGGFNNYMVAYSFYCFQGAQPKDIKVGDVVAAPFEFDQSWYRARICEILEDGLDLYYLDFGDNGNASRDSIRELRGDFLSLPFQAFECCLANVKPAGELVFIILNTVNHGIFTLL